MAEVINQTLIPKIKLSSGEEIPAWEWEPSVLTALQQSRFPMP